MADKTVAFICTHNACRSQMAEALGVTDGLCDGCAPGILKMYDAYIEGKMELTEVNADFHARYVVEHEDERGMQGASCVEGRI